MAAPSEVCTNSLDDNCNGSVDEGCSACIPDGTYTRDGGAMIYTCCGGLVSVNVRTFQLSSGGAVINTGPGFQTLTGQATTCPSGPVRGSLQIPGGCTETYTIDGGFVGPNEWRGTYRATFTGPDCDCFGGLFGTPCVNQSWPVQAFR
jgi:hypothetical protein